MIRFCAVVALFVSSIAASGAEDDAWYLVEFAASRPVCDRSAPASEADTGERAGQAEPAPASAPSTSGCWSTGPRISAFEVRNAEVIEMPASGDIPPAWVAFRHLWLYAPGADSGGFRMSINRTPSGVRLQLQEGSVYYLETLPLDTWVRLDPVNARQLWARVRESTGG